VEEFNAPLDEYLRRCEEQLARPVPTELATEPSDEYAAPIIHALETGEPFRFNGNVMNDGLIDNLPACCVEVPCVADARGITPEPVGALPPQLAALIQTNVNVQALTVEAALTGSRDHLYHAAMLDPHTAAELSLQEIHDLVDQLLVAHSQ
jgi:alpha-galactosidase